MLGFLKDNRIELAVAIVATLALSAAFRLIFGGGYSLSVTDSAVVLFIFLLVAKAVTWAVRRFITAGGKEESSDER